MDYHIGDNTNSIRFLSSMFGVLLYDLKRYLMLYESILSELDHFLDALDNLSNNQLSHSVIPPNVINDLINHVKEVLSTKYPNYELVFLKCMTIITYPSLICMQRQYSDSSHLFLHQAYQPRTFTHV